MIGNTKICPKYPIDQGDFVFCLLANDVIILGWKGVTSAFDVASSTCPVFNLDFKRENGGGRWEKVGEKVG